MIRLPHPATTAGAMAGSWIALAPSLLPRSAAVEAGILILLTAIGALAGGAIALAGPRRWRRLDGGSRRWALGIAMGLGIAGVTQAVHWQNALRAALPAPQVDAGWIAATAIAPVITLTVGMLVTHAAAAAARWLWERHRMVTGAIAAAVGVLAAAVPGVASAATTAAAPHSTVAADFRSAAARPGSLRVYEPITSAPYPDRARNLVRQWESRGGMQRRAVVIAVPTGSGWVDGDALAGFEQRFDGDVGVLAMQYADEPSWRAFVGGTGPARESSTALARAVVAAVKSTEPHHRPAVYIYGQSLGAIGADAARSAVTTDGDAAVICQTVLAGPPAGTVRRHDPDTLYLLNGSDPVTHWRPSIIWSPPTDPAAASHDLPRPRWLPLVSFLSTSADLLGALSFPAGHGHQYGTEQGTRVRGCAAGAPGRGVVQPIGPRAAS
ncbi:alpha/beta-hydrolase family protein [Jongsikchunia kroppenstedtii]|uniref:alpha/beta-hydrolase family protein n=1 Tax=Jongsikchunia kroppenstedtii TaxID=1121721 RepID=UPI00039AEB16|nr:alpha/beta-hydrolase family protein [Jongsikchunia kroppenstedtii]